MTSLAKPALFVLLTAVLAAGRVWPEKPYRSTAEGVYTKEQAKRGEEVHRKACLRCHHPDFYTGGLVDSWAGNTVGALNANIANTMPEDRPSSLKPEEYADLMAYLLMINKFPVGEEELPSDDTALARIIIERSKQ